MWEWNIMELSYPDREGQQNRQMGSCQAAFGKDHSLSIEELPLGGRRPHPPVEGDRWGGGGQREKHKKGGGGKEDSIFPTLR